MLYQASKRKISDFGSARKRLSKLGKGPTFAEKIGQLTPHIKSSMGVKSRDVCHWS